MSDSLAKRMNTMKNQRPIVAEILKACEQRKLKHDNNIENLMIFWPGGFTAMISRVSHFFQFYLKGFGHNMHIDHIENVENLDHFFELAAQYKERLESGEIIRIVETLPDPDEMDDEIDNILQLSGEPQYIVINTETRLSEMFMEKKEIHEFLNCSRAAVNKALKGELASIKGHVIKKIV